MSAAKAKTKDPSAWKLDGSSWANAWKAFAVVGVLGLAGAGLGYVQDPRRFAFSWLFAFVTVLTMALGALFFVLVQRLTSAGWSVTVRRTAEFFALGLIAMVPLFVPVLLSMNALFPWLHEHSPESGHTSGPTRLSALQLITPAYAQGHDDKPKNEPGLGGDKGHEPVEKTPSPHGEQGHGVPAQPHPGDLGGHLPGSKAGPPGDSPPGVVSAEGPPHGSDAAHGPMGDPHEQIEKKILEKKKPYLNRTFFLIRAGLYFLIWVLVALRLFQWSTAQDRSKDPGLTLAAQRFAPPATFLFALSLTFAAFDWIMSLEPTWFSTIFGVVIFACGVVASYAVIILTTLALRDAGPLDGAVTVEHYHDLGKLMFGFLVFWAYVSFSQYMLIWYAALPEETTFFHNRWDYAPWTNVSMALILFHFVLPFFWVMSRTFKRNTGRLQIGAAILLVMHVVDMYWFVMPNFHLGKPGFSFHWLDAACLLAVVGVYGAFVFHRMTRFPLVPIGDPRLERSLHFQNA